MRKFLALLVATAFVATPVFADNSNDVLQQVPGQGNSNQAMQVASADADAAVGPVSEAQAQKTAPQGTMTLNHAHKKCHKNCHCNKKHCKAHHKHHHHKAKTDANAPAANTDQTAPAANDQSAAPAAAPAQ